MRHTLLSQTIHLAAVLHCGVLDADRGVSRRLRHRAGRVLSLLAELRAALAHLIAQL